MQTLTSSIIAPTNRVLGLLAAVLFTAGFLSAQDDKRADDAYNAAANLFNIGLYQQAIPAYQEYLKEHAQHEKAIDARYGLGISYYNLKQFDNAAKELAQVAASPKAPDAPRAHLLHGQCMLMLNKSADAEKSFDAGLKAVKDPNANAAVVSQLKISQLEAQFQQKKWQNVITSANELKGKAGARNTRVAFQGAFARYNLKKYDEVARDLAALKQDVKGTPYEQQTHFLLAEALREQEKFKEAVTEFATAAGLPGGFAADALFRQAFLEFNNLQDYKAAAGHFDDYRVKHKDKVPAERYLEARIYLGRSFLELKDFNNSEKVFNDLAGEPGATSWVFIWQGRVLQRQQKYQEAVKVIETAIGKFPNDPQAASLQFDLANNYLGLDQFEKAGTAFDQVLKKDNAFAQKNDVLRLNALCKHRTKAFEASLGICAEYLKDHGQSQFAADVKFLAAENHFFLDQHAKAITAFNGFLKDHNQHAQAAAARMRIGQSEFTLKNWTKALTALEPLVKDGAKGPVFDQLEFLVGDAHYQQGNWAAAVQNYNRFVEAKAKSINADTALMKAGLANEKLDKKADAVRFYERLAKDYPQSNHLGHANLQLGVIHYNAKEMAKAKAALQGVARDQDHKLRPDAEYFLGFVAREEGDLAAAARQFAAMADAFPQHDLAADARLQQGNVQLDNQKSAEAMKAFEKYLADYPQEKNVAEATFKLGLAQMGQDQWGASLASFAKVPADSEWADNALYRSAWAAKGDQKAEAAIGHYKALLSGHADSEFANPATLELAELEFEAKEYQPAVDRLNKLIAKKPAEALLARAQYRLGWCQFQLKEYAKAAVAYEAMLAKAPKELLITAAWQAGECRLKSKQPTEALANYLIATGADKPQAEDQVVLQQQALLRVGQCQGQLMKWTDSEKTFKQFITSHPSHPHLRAAQKGLGWSLQNQQKLQDAIGAFEPVLAQGIRDELGAHTQFLLGECYLDLKEFDKAITEFAKVEALFAFPEWQSKSLYEIGVAITLKGKPEQAEVVYKRVIEKYPNTAAAAAAKEKLN